MSGRLPAPPFLLLGALSLLAGLWAGLLRLPLALPAPHGLLALVHGPLMAAAFLGTVIAAERAAALGGRLLHWLPAVASGAGGLVLVLGPLLADALPVLRASGLLFATGAAGLLALYVPILRRQPAFFNQVMALGAAALLAGNILFWAGRPPALSAPWWTAFLVLTIAGERLELNRLLRPSPAAAAVFRAILLLMVAGLATSAWSPEPGARLQGAGHLALALWLVRNDVARRTLRLGGLAGYAALCLLGGYAWLGVSGLLALLGPFQLAGPWHDAGLHALYLGFVFSMIFGHAPIIVPALIGRAVRVNRAHLAPLLLLHAGLLLRIAGDLLDAPWARQWGGLGGALAIGLFLVMLAASLDTIANSIVIPLSMAKRQST